MCSQINKPFSFRSIFNDDSPGKRTELKLSIQFHQQMYSTKYSKEYLNPEDFVPFSLQHEMPSGRAVPAFGSITRNSQRPQRASLTTDWPGKDAPGPAWSGVPWKHFSLHCAPHTSVCSCISLRTSFWCHSSAQCRPNGANQSENMIGEMTNHTDREGTNSLSAWRGGLVTYKFWC